MIYQYSQKNRLEEPHHYMYTSFQGYELLASYHSSRLDLIRDLAVANQKNEALDAVFMIYALSIMEYRINQTSSDAAERLWALLKADSFTMANSVTDDKVTGLANSLIAFTISESVRTQDLLNALISALLIRGTKADTKIWLDRLVQRFEVTKKLYETYQPSFRKGEDSSTKVRLYWLFALALSLYYLKYNEIKYLSALLKICDLLCSLPKDVLENTIPPLGLKLVLIAEIFSVQLLAEQKGICLEST